MINALSGLLHRSQVFKNGFHLTKSFPNLTCTVQRRPSCLKYFSGGIVHYQGDKGQETVKQERHLPTLIYIQNPITWCINKIDFKMLKTAWDPDFDENEFKRGTKQAVSVICSFISKNMWENLRGLITRQALSRLQREVQINWSDEQRRNIDLTPIDIKLVLPRKVHFLRIVDQRFVDVDMMFVAMKFREPDPSKNDDLILIEMVARFHRNYTPQQLPNWTVTLFKITRFDVTPARKYTIDTQHQTETPKTIMDDSHIDNRKSGKGR